MRKYVRKCRVFQQRNRQAVMYAGLHFTVPKFQFIPMDHISQFHDPRSSAGNFYALTVICLLTGYIFYLPIKYKSATAVIRACIDHAFAKF